MSVVSDIILAGVFASIPAASSANDGYLYFATDTVVLYRSNGSAWVATAAAGGTGVFVKADGSVAFTADQSMGSHKLTNVTDPASAQDAATKTYVDSIAVNLGKRTRVRAATTANITISTALNNADTLDGVTLATGDLVLVKNQSAAEGNGIYVVGVSPARFAEFDTYDEHPGSLIAVQEGTANADTAWLCTSNVGGTLNTTALNFSALSSGGAGSDTTAVHVSTANEISGITEKTTLHNDDLFIIEDSEASGVKKRVKKSNVATGGGGAGAMVFLGARTASSSALLLFDSLISGTYDKYVLEIVDFIAQTDNVNLNMQYSVDNGSSYATGSDYYNGVGNVQNGGAYAGGGGNPTTAFQLALGVKNTSSRPVHGTIYLQSFPSTAVSKAIYGQTFYTNQSNVVLGLIQGLLLIPGTAYNSFKLFFSSGNIVSGVARLYGIANS